MINRMIREAQVRAALLMTDDSGMSTAEYPEAEFYYRALRSSFLFPVRR